MNYWLEYSNNELGPTFFFLPWAFSNNSNIPINTLTTAHFRQKEITFPAQSITALILTAQIIFSNGIN